MVEIAPPQNGKLSRNVEYKKDGCITTKVIKSLLLCAKKMEVEIDSLLILMQIDLKTSWRRPQRCFSQRERIVLPVSVSRPFFSGSHPLSLRQENQK